MVRHSWYDFGLSSSLSSLRHVAAGQWREFTCQSSLRLNCTWKTVDGSKLGNSRRKRDTITDHRRHLHPRPWVHTCHLNVEICGRDLEHRRVKQLNNYSQWNDAFERVLMGSNSNHLQTTTLSPFWEIPQLSPCSILVLFSETLSDVFLPLPPWWIPLAQREREKRVNGGKKKKKRKRGKGRRMRKKETDRRDVTDKEVTEMKEKWETHKADSVPAMLIDKWGNRCLGLYKITPGSYMWSSYLPSFCSSTLHPPKILSVTTRRPAEPESMMWAQIIVLFGFILLYHYLGSLSKKHRIAGECQDLVSLDFHLNFPFSVLELNEKFILLWRYHLCILYPLVPANHQKVKNSNPSCHVFYDGRFQQIEISSSSSYF